MLTKEKWLPLNNVVQLPVRAEVQQDPSWEVMRQLLALLTRLEAGTAIGLALVVLEANGNYITAGSGVFCSDSQRGFIATQILQEKFA